MATEVAVAAVVEGNGQRNQLFLCTRIALEHRSIPCGFADDPAGGEARSL